MPHRPLPPPRPLDVTMTKALEARHSTHAFDGAAALSVERLGDLLHWSAGIREPMERASSPPLRFYPSAGACYPIELYVAVRRIRGIEPGVYHWHRDRHVLASVPVRHDADAIYATLKCSWHRDAAAIVILTARPAAMLERKGARGYRFTLIEAGAVLQNLGLVAAALGLGGCAIGTAWDTDVQTMLGLDEDEETAIAGFAVGAPGVVSAHADAPVTATTSPQSATDSRPYRASVVVPLDGIAALPYWSTGRVPGLSAARAAEHALGLRLCVELPEELYDAPSWASYAALRRFRDAGLDVRWARTRGRPDEPAFEAWSVTLGSLGHGTGIDAFSSATALDKAVGEAVERWAWFGEAPAPASLYVGPPGTLERRAIPLESIAGYSSALRSAHPEALGWTDRTEFAWVEGTSLTTGERRWVPLQVASGSRALGSVDNHRREAELRPRVTTGVAAAAERPAAIFRGLLEVIERDAFMLTWLRRLPVQALDLDHTAVPELAEIAARFRAARLEPRAFRLPTDAPVDVVLGVLHDATGGGPAVAVGAAARTDLAHAAAAALTEAFAVWRRVRALVDDGHTVPTTASELDRDGRLLWWSDPQRWPLLAWLLDATKIAVEPSPTPARDVDADLADLVAWFRASREDVIVVDLVDEALAYRLGHHVVSTIVPGFHPVHIHEARPALWSARVTSVPRALGLLASVSLNTIPHPFP